MPLGIPLAKLSPADAAGVLNHFSVITKNRWVLLSQQLKQNIKPNFWTKDTMRQGYWKPLVFFVPGTLAAAWVPGS